MNTDHLEYFLAICGAATRSQAAEGLFISPQGLGKAIHKLEHELGVALFEPDGRTLTEYGEALKVHAAHIVVEQRELHRRFDEIARRANEGIRVAFSYGVLGSLGISFMEDFDLAHRGISVNYVQVPDLECERMLLEREADIGFTVAPYSSAFDTWELRCEDSCLWVGSDNPLAGRPSANIDDLRNQRIAMIGKGLKMFEALPRICRERGFELNVAFSSPEMGVVKQLAGKGGLASLTVSHESADRPPGVWEIPIEGLPWRFGASVLRNWVPSEAQEEFIEFAKRYAR